MAVAVGVAAADDDAVAGVDGGAAVAVVAALLPENETAPARGICSGVGFPDCVVETTLRCYSLRL